MTVLVRPTTDENDPVSDAGASLTRYAWTFGALEDARSLAREALRRAASTRLTVLRWHGEAKGSTFVHQATSVLAEFDASVELAFFARFCAHQVAEYWPITDVVRTFIITGASELAETAHHSAWAMSTELEGSARLAARVAMFACFTDRLVIAAREAALLASRIIGANASGAAIAATEAQEHVLVSALLGRAFVLEESHLAEGSQPEWRCG